MLGSSSASAGLFLLSLGDAVYPSGLASLWDSHVYSQRLVFLGRQVV